MSQLSWRQIGKAKTKLVIDSWPKSNLKTTRKNVNPPEFRPVINQLIPMWNVSSILVIGIDAVLSAGDRTRLMAFLVLLYIKGPTSTCFVFELLNRHSPEAYVGP